MCDQHHHARHRCPQHFANVNLFYSSLNNKCGETQQPEAPDKHSKARKYTCYLTQLLIGLVLTIKDMHLHVAYQ
jgi:hypothetical protein